MDLGQSFGQTYSVFQNKDSVGFYVDVYDSSDIIGFGLVVSKFATNVKSNSFEITFPYISGIDTLTAADILNSELLGLVYELSGNHLVLKKSIVTNDQLLQAVNFTVAFIVSNTLDPTSDLVNVKSGLTFYSEKTFKYQLNTNDTGVIEYDNKSYSFSKNG